MEDIQATLAAEDEGDEGGSTQNDQASSSNAEKEHSSRASSLSPPPEDIQEPKWDMTQDNDQRDEQGKQDDGIEDIIVVNTSAIKRERSFAKRNWQLAQQDDDAEDTIVIDTTTRKAERSSDRSNKKSAQKQNNARETTAIEPKAKYDETTWTRFERPTEQQKKDYYARGNKIPGYLPTWEQIAEVDFRVKTQSELEAEAAQEAERKRLKEIISNPKQFDQNGPEWPWRKIWIRPLSKPYEKSPFWVEEKDIPEWIEYCKHQRKIQEDKLKIDVRNGVFKEQRGAVYYAETNGRDWRIRQELGVT